MSTMSNTPYSELEVGQKATYSKTVEERDIQLFAAMSGDHNPVHLDAEFAATTIFRERIAHGMFSGALISAAVACELPGPGTIYIGQTMRFVLPVKLGDTLTVRLEILEKLPKFRVRIATQVFNQRDEMVVDGEAEILAPRKAQTVEIKALPPVNIG
ncbi:MaoC family dehydratase [Pseudomonas sp. SST3]|uniref:MaoC family dehydratase n=1 Tax=Pseudomonas sp. SST3 TaxID=2267882 RepID=UPI000DFE334F|nr:MaoC family dehydratase [Pseudomonas sp. SST3]NKQ11974.1 MaoC family dehydratase [Pseudomonas sp. SST3]